MEVHETQPAALFRHNKHFFMRAYPKGLRLNSSNLNPSIFWRAGVQIVALNWQRWDGGMMQNEAMFAGTGGWVLKPEGYRSSSDEKLQKHAIPHHNLDLSIEFFAGQDIPLPPEEDDPKDFKPYIKVELHVEKRQERSAEPIPGGGKGNKGEFKKKTKTYRTTNPDFGGELIKFEGVQGVTEELTFVRYVDAAMRSLFILFRLFSKLYDNVRPPHAFRHEQWGHLFRMDNSPLCRLIMVSCIFLLPSQQRHEPPRHTRVRVSATQGLFRCNGSAD